MGDSKRYKIDSVAKTRKLTDDHPFVPKSGKIYAVPISRTGASSVSANKSYKENVRKIKTRNI